MINVFRRIIDWAEEPDWDSARGIARTLLVIVGFMVAAVIVFVALVLMSWVGGIILAGALLYGLYRWVRLALRPVNR